MRYKHILWDITAPGTQLPAHIYRKISLLIKHIGSLVAKQWDSMWVITAVAQLRL